MHIQLAFLHRGRVRLRVEVNAFSAKCVVTLTFKNYQRKTKRVFATAGSTPAIRQTAVLVARKPRDAACNFLRPLTLLLQVPKGQSRLYHYAA